MKRRSFIKNSSVATIPVILGKVNVSALNNPFFKLLNQEDDRVLVLIQMSGGNDGLNTILPKDQYANLAAVRSNVLVPENSILDLTDTLGFHPNMAGLKNVYDAGKLNIIQGVAYPDQNRSHFRSTDIWQTGSSAKEVWTTGWLGRYFNLLHPDYPTGYPNEDFPDPFAITIGSSVSETCEGTGGNFSTALVDPGNLSALATPVNRTLPNTCFGEQMEFLVNSISQTNSFNEVIEVANNKGANLSSKYGENNLANKLKVVARLIAGGLKTKVYVVNIGGFDTHSNQVLDGDTSTGIHANLLAQLSNAIEAFQEDLQLLNLDQRVVGLTFSEFGRRIRSNDSLGTDHGTAAPMMVFGTCVNPEIIGDNPTISREADRQEGVAMQFDFRSVYSSLLIDWFGVAEQTVRDLLYPDFQHLPILNDCSQTTATNFLDPKLVQVAASPNPFREQTQLEFSVKSGWVKISLFNAIGSELQVLTNQKFSEGTHQLSLNTSNLATGSYICHIQTDYGQQAIRVVKVR